MSWAEVKKLNSDLSTPLNIANLINHIDLVGDQYIGSNNEALTKALILSDSLYSHSIASTIVGMESFSTQLKAESYGYIWLCKTTNIPYESFTGLSDMFNDDTAMTAILANATVLDFLLKCDGLLYSMCQNSNALKLLSSSINGNTTTTWETSELWDKLYSTLNASSLFTKSGLLSDFVNYNTVDRRGNLITLIVSAYSTNQSAAGLGITPANVGCYTHAKTYNWSTNKHIMWGGHLADYDNGNVSTCVVKHYMFTPIT